MSIRIPKILITGATGQVGSKTIDFLLDEKEIEVVAAIRSHVDLRKLAVTMRPIAARAFCSAKVRTRGHPDLANESNAVGCLRPRWDYDFSFVYTICCSRSRNLPRTS
jgi:nucleoside-diphosphate-sugar epimerase